MTRKTRRSKPADVSKPQPPSDSKPRQGEAPPPAATAPPPTATKVALPAFGFAEDLLEKSTAAPR